LEAFGGKSSIYPLRACVAGEHRIDRQLFRFEKVLRGFAVEISQQNQLHDAQTTAPDSVFDIQK
jgi:hypothetical protein